MKEYDDNYDVSILSYHKALPGFIRTFAGYNMIESLSPLRSTTASSIASNPLSVVVG